jgi:hypothetical protein
MCFTYVTSHEEWSLEDITTDRCTIPTITKLIANLKRAEAFFRHHTPNLSLQIISLTSPSPILPSNNQTANWHHSLYPEKRHTESYSNHLKRTCNCQWGMPLANGYTQLGTVYHHIILSKDGDIAWRILHNKTSHHNSCTNGVNETQMTALGAQEPQVSQTAHS